MDRRVILGAVAGAVVIIGFSFGILLLWNIILINLISSMSNMVISFIAVLIAPFAGGFLAGLIAHPNSQKAGLLAGLGAGLLVLIAWFVISSISFQTLTSGILIVFVWAVLARLSSGFVRARNED